MEQETNQTAPPPDRKYNWLYTKAYGIALALGSFQFGYMMTIHNALMYTSAKSDDTKMSFCINILEIGALLGCVLMGFLAERLGRRQFLIFANIVLLVSLPLYVLPDKYSFDDRVIYVGRALSGIAVGIFGVCVPMFLKEIAPRDKMGALGMYHQIMISIGNELAFVVYALSQTYQKANLRGAAIMVTGMIALLQLYFLFFQFTYDSPRYLIMKEDIDSCEAAITPIYPVETDRSKELFELKKAKEDDKYKFVRWSDVFCSRFYRYACLIGCLVIFFQQFTGINIIMFLSSDVLRYSTKEDDTFSQIILALCLGAANIVGTVLAYHKVETLGRKWLFIIGNVIILCMLIALIVLSFFDTHKPMITISVIVAFAIGYGFSFGPLCWVYLSEVSPTKGVILANGVHWVLAMALPFPFTLKQNLNDEEDTTLYKVFLSACCGVMVLGLLFFIFVLKETKSMYPRAMKYLYAPFDARSVASSNDDEDESIDNDSSEDAR